MTSGANIDVREVIFINPDAEAHYAHLPDAVAEIADGVIVLLQNGRIPARQGRWRMLRGHLSGTGEVSVDDQTETFRIYLWLGCPRAIYILDAGMKKLPNVHEIPAWHDDRLIDRRLRATRDCANRKPVSAQARSPNAARRPQPGPESAPQPCKERDPLSEIGAFDVPDWRNNPDEFKPPVRCGSFLAGRGYENPEMAAVKICLAEDIQCAISRLDMTESSVAAKIAAAGVAVSQPDIAAIVNGNVRAFALERLLQAAAALGAR